jgi:hypothetical protein
MPPTIGKHFFLNILLTFTFIVWGLSWP